MIDLPPPQMQCIARVVQSEAGGESEVGKRAVAHVIINRTKDKRFPSTPCAVIMQRGQFVSNKSGKINFKLGEDPTGGALYFKNTTSRARWPYKLTVRIGNHLFYK